MKTITKTLILMIVFSFQGCDSDGVIEEQTIEPKTEVIYDWQITVQSVNSTTEDVNNNFFSYFILGQPDFGFEGLINSTLFRLVPSTNRVEIKNSQSSSFVRIWGWAGPDTPWLFTYRMEDNRFTFDGISTEGVTFYCVNDNEVWLNTFHFEGELDSQANQVTYNGIYVWSEIRGDEECIRIEGDMTIRKN